MRKTSLCVVVSFFVFLSGCLQEPPNPINEMQIYLSDNEKTTFSQFFSDFDWDECYNDIDYYGLAKEISEATGYEVELPALGDHLHRFVFFNEGQYIKNVTYEFGIFHFPDDVFVFYPDTVFLAEWNEVLTSVGMQEHLFIFPENYNSVGLRQV